jgi:hypothetical protein
MPRKSFDDVIPANRNYAWVRNILEAEAASRPGGADISDLVREALQEYIAGHDLIKKHGFTFDEKTKQITKTEQTIKSKKR